MTIHIIDDVLTQKEVDWVRAMLETVGWVRGSETAGPIAAGVKNNWQAKIEDTNALRSQLLKKLGDNAEFQAIVRPQVVGLMFSRYDQGNAYGPHVDAAVMQGVRRDVSFTLELSEDEMSGDNQNEYDGGALIIENGSRDENLKLRRGSMVVYPATSLHHVTPITRGSRFVVVGWARSYIRDADKRELLYELDLAKSSIFAKDGKTPEVDLISRASANLMRMWMED